MPRFFFDFRQGEDRCPDAEGVDFATVEQAYLEAHKGAQDMWSELLRQRQDPRRCAFEVRNDRRELLFVLPFHEVVDNCLDRPDTPPEKDFDMTGHAMRVSEEFIEELRSAIKALAETRAALRSRF